MITLPVSGVSHNGGTPYRLWWRTKKERELPEVRDFGDDGETVDSGKFPDLAVRRRIQLDVLHMLAFRGTAERAHGPDFWRGSGRAATSCRCCEPSLPLGRKRERCPNVLIVQFGEVAQNLLGAHSRGEILKDVMYRDPGADKAWLTASHAITRLD